jgi:hypothetical protein
VYVRHTISLLRFRVIECSRNMRNYQTVNVKQSPYRPGQAKRVPGDSGSQISRQSTSEGGKVVSRSNRPPLHPGNIPGTRFC